MRYVDSKGRVITLMPAGERYPDYWYIGRKAQVAYYPHQVLSVVFRTRAEAEAELQRQAKRFGWRKEEVQECS